MNALYRTVGISKQGFHQQLDKYLSLQDEKRQLLSIVMQIRREYPSLSARQMYFMLCPVHLGRDRFEAFCFRNGFKIEKKRSFRRTTNSWGVTRFPNLLPDVQLTGINQVWVSDITYYQIGERFFFLTFIMDLYSRRIVGYSASENLLTENTTLPATEMALATRAVASKLVFHSDGGGQYYCKEFVELIRRHAIRSSMAETVYENAFAERLNGLIKNDYLRYYNPTDFKELLKQLTRAVRNYNSKPHSELERLSPIDYETKCGNVEDSQRKNRIAFSKVTGLRISHIPDISATMIVRKKRLKTVNPIQA
jgi:transposase InsO family protein